ncbi:hypothetical protein CS0771_00750 [Catellatospora sp. IY07-71]|uniref:hypothetical protein n=1 Tax=Catellatospora sp. IY07-71 TaxID=2728827 RepID=UPI001BB4122C|nr:hypothetical protein [Catellatospora sp. IY07-71]BCJ70531.1 hypothetical protein CS0771_00750 [Catellatospora sp. IY07-71]
MRRLLAAAVLGAALFTAAACADTPEPSAAPTASAGVTAEASPGAGVVPSGSAGVPGVGATADTKAVCAAVTTESKKFITNLVTKAQEAGTSLSDPDKAKAFLDALAKDYVALSTALKTESAKTADPGLKKALDDLTKALDASAAALGDPQKLAQDPSKIQSILFSEELSAANEALDKICPTA